MHYRLLTQYAIIMVQFLAGLRKIKLRPGPGCVLIILLSCTCTPYACLQNCKIQNRIFIEYFDFFRTIGLIELSKFIIPIGNKILT